MAELKKETNKTKHDNLEENHILSQRIGLFLGTLCVIGMKMWFHFNLQFS